MNEIPSQQKPDEIIEFQPDALEIQDQRLPLLVRLCVWMPLFLTAIAILWAYLAKTDVVVRTQGKLVTPLQTIVMKPLERSVVKKIHVRIGDTVKKDQVLITFDPTINNAEMERLKHEIRALSAQLARLKAEFNQTPYNAADNQSAAWQSVIYKQRQEYYNQRIKYFDEALKQIEASHKSKQDSLNKQKERLTAVRQLEEMYSGLQQKNVVSLKELIEMQITRMEMEATVDQLANDLLELVHRRGSTIAEKESFIQEWRKQISEEMVNIDRGLSSTQKELDKTMMLVDYVEIKAPCDAVVHEVASFSPGSAVREAEAVITLVPLIGNLEVEAELRPEDISKVEKGAEAQIKLSAYPYQKHGTLEGNVLNISENTFEREGQSAMLNGTSYYRLRLTVSGTLKRLKNKDTFRLIPGMQAECDIKCGKRRVIEFVLYPLLKALKETGREP